MKPTITHRSRPERGPSSYWLHNPEEVFAAFCLRSGQIFLDLGCGPGDYSLAAAELVGKQGMILAIDTWKSMLADLRNEAIRLGYAHIFPLCADITRPLPLIDRCIDICLIATVLHMPGRAALLEGMFAEIRRVLKKSGRLAIIEFTNADLPQHVRVSPEMLEAEGKRHGFKRQAFLDWGRTYMLTFSY